MSSSAFSYWRTVAAAGVCLAASLASASATAVEPADLEAAVRTFEFVDSMQRHSPITVNVVYKTGDAESKAVAQKAAGILSELPGPNSSKIVTSIVSASELAQGGKHVDVIYLPSGTGDGNRAAGEFARREHVLSISNDPGCLNTRCCALMVRAGARTEVVLDTSVAQETGTKFSTVFIMMVKRR